MSMVIPGFREGPAVVSAVGRLIVLASLLVLGSGCGEDEQVPAADHEVKVRRSDFFPDSLFVEAGESVRWVNTLSQSTENRRTVTSGDGPSDPQAGTLFDAVLEGYSSGNAFGDYFVYLFQDPGRYPYFTQLPAGGEYSGVIIVN
jgi:plastocyanin